MYLAEDTRAPIWPLFIYYHEEGHVKASVLMLRP